MITAREEERRRLRRDLHDGLGPVLTGVVLNAEAALRLVEADPQRSAELITALRDQTTGALTDIRRLVYDLRPPALDSLGLVGALQEYAMLLTRRADGAAARRHRTGHDHDPRPSRGRRGGRLPDRHRGADQRHPPLQRHLGDGDGRPSTTPPWSSPCTTTASTSEAAGSRESD